MGIYPLHILTLSGVLTFKWIIISSSLSVGKKTILLFMEYNEIQDYTRCITRFEDCIMGKDVPVYYRMSTFMCTHRQTSMGSVGSLACQ